MDLLVLGAERLFTASNIGWLLVGMVVGLFAGATPAISGVVVVALVLSFTFGFEPTASLILMTAVYAAAVFSGSISAILFRIPGAPEAAATVFDGYEMARRGDVGPALGHAVFASCLGGTFGAIMFMLVSPELARFALRFGAPEIAVLILFTMVAVARLGGGNPLKGMVCGAFGLFLSIVGMDITFGTYRFTFGVRVLAGGIELVPAILGLFALSEAFRLIQRDISATKKAKRTPTVMPRWPEIVTLLPTYVRSGIIGLFTGILPGVGATTASFISYATANRFSKQPEKFGSGCAEGIAAPETANNAAAMGAMVPLFSLGIPGSGTTAVMLAAMVLHGLRPGPYLIINQPAFVGALMLTAIICNLLIIVMAPGFIRIFVRMIRTLPMGVLGAVILVFCVVGAFTVRNSMVDVFIMIAFGLLAYVLEKHKYPIAPIVIGLVLGELFESQFVRSLAISGGDPMIFFTRPIATPIVVVTLLLLLIPVCRALWCRFVPSRGD